MSIPESIQSALPQAHHARLLEMRTLIFDAAKATQTLPLTETLKWGQPAYLPAMRAGTTLRLGEQSEQPALFVHCQTSLVDTWRQRYGDELTFVGNREISIPTDTDLPRAPLQHCIAMALTYHARKRS